MPKIIIIFVYLTVIILAGCSAQNEEKAVTESMQDEEYSNDLAQVGDKKESVAETEKSESNPSLSERKIIHKANTNQIIDTFTPSCTP